MKLTEKDFENIFEIIEKTSYKVGVLQDLKNLEPYDEDKEVTFSILGNERIVKKGETLISIENIEIKQSHAVVFYNEVNSTLQYQPVWTPEVSESIATDFIVEPVEDEQL